MAVYQYESISINLSSQIRIFLNRNVFFDISYQALNPLYSGRAYSCFGPFAL